MKKFFMKNGEGGELKVDILKVIITTLLTLVVGAIFTWGRWVTIQSYEVATNKNNILKTAERLAGDIAGNKAYTLKIEDELKKRLDRTNQVLHGRSTRLDEKYDAKMTEMQRLLMQTNKLVVDMLVQQNEEVKLKKEEVEMQKQMPQYQQHQQQVPRWPMSPHNNH